MEIAKEKDINELFEFYKDVIENINRSRVVIGWDIEKYPNRAFIEETTGKDEMLLIREEGKIIAAAAVNHTVNPEYDDIDWEVKADRDKIATIHALAVSPLYRGGTVSRRFLSEIEDYCRGNGDLAIHLDVIDINVPAKKLYIKCGYKEIEAIKMYYEVVGTREFFMMEKVL